MKTYENVAKGSHVLIATEANIYSSYRLFTQDFRCKYPRDKFQTSKSSLTTIMGGWMFKKNFPWRSVIDTNLMWMESFGIMRRQQNDVMRFYEQKSGLYDPKIHPDEKCYDFLPENFAEVTGSFECDYSEDSPLIPMSLKHTKNSFIILGIGHFISTMIFAFRYFYAKIISKAKII